MPPDIFDLSAQKPLAEGRDQLIYQHPGQADWIIKTVKPDEKKRRFRRYAVWRYRRLRGWHREISEYTAMLGRCGRHCDRLPRYFGFCDTTIGPGMVVEKITGPDGKLAPTFAQFLRKKPQSAETLIALRADVDLLFDTLQRDGIDFHDFHLRNTVVTGTDQPRLMVIDGIGTPALIPLTQFSRHAFSRVGQSGRRHLHKALDQAIARAQANNPT